MHTDWPVDKFGETSYRGRLSSRHSSSLLSDTAHLSPARHPTFHFASPQPVSRSFHAAPAAVYSTNTSATSSVSYTPPQFALSLDSLSSPPLLKAYSEPDTSRWTSSAAMAELMDAPLSDTQSTSPSSSPSLSWLESTSSSQQQSVAHRAPPPVAARLLPPPAMAPVTASTVHPYMVASVASASASSPSASSSSPSTTAATRRRHRAAGLTNGQRSEIRKQKHRNIDLRRRMREQSAINALQRLIDESTWKRSSSPAHHERPSDLINEEDSEVRAKKNKSLIMEETARKYSELQQTVQRLTDSNRAHVDTIKSLVQQLVTQQAANSARIAVSNGSSSPAQLLSLLPLALSTRVSAELSSHVLHSSCLLSASLSMLLICADSGCVLDMNDQTLSSTGWEKSHLLGRRITPPWNSIPTNLDVPWSRELRARLDIEGVWVDGLDGHMVPAKIQPQYRKVMLQTIDMHEGRIDHVKACPFRLQLKSAQSHTHAERHAQHTRPPQRDG